MGDDHQSDTERYEMALKLVRDAWLVAWLDGGREIEEDLKVEHSYKRVGEARGFTLDETPKGKPTVQAVRRWVIPFDKEIGGKAIFVKVKLNNKLDVTYHLDTGASLVTISRATARELGIQVTRETKRISVMTANGVLEVPLVELESVGIADAVALKVRADLRLDAQHELANVDADELQIRYALGEFQKFLRHPDHAIERIAHQAEDLRAALSCERRLRFKHVEPDGNIRHRAPKIVDDPAGHLSQRGETLLIDQLIARIFQLVLHVLERFGQKPEFIPFEILADRQIKISRADFLSSIH